MITTKGRTTNEKQHMYVHVCMDTRTYIYIEGESEKERTKIEHITFILSSSYGASGAVILVISLMQEATATFTSTSECFKRFSMTSAFISGEKAFCMDFAGDCSTFDKRSSICLNQIKRNSDYTTRNE